MFFAIPYSFFHRVEKLQAGAIFSSHFRVPRKSRFITRFWALSLRLDAPILLSRLLWRSSHSLRQLLEHFWKFPILFFQNSGKKNVDSACATSLFFHDKQDDPRKLFLVNSANKTQEIELNDLFWARIWFLLNSNIITNSKCQLNYYFYHAIRSLFSLLFSLLSRKPIFLFVLAFSFSCCCRTSCPPPPQE